MFFCHRCAKGNNSSALLIMGKGILKITTPQGVIEDVCQEFCCESTMSSGQNVWPTHELPYHAELSQEYLLRCQDLEKKEGRS